MEGVLRCVLTCLLGMSAVVMMDTHWMEMECLAMVRHACLGCVGVLRLVCIQPSMVNVTIHTRSSFEYVCGYCCDKTVHGECMNTRSGGSRGGVLWWPQLQAFTQRAPLSLWPALLQKITVYFRITTSLLGTSRTNVVIVVAAQAAERAPPSPWIINYS